MPTPLDDPAFQALYEVRGVLGRGAMGEVARIRHRVWETELAAKVPLATAVREAGGLERFRREAETWVALAAHPCVVACHYVRVFGGVPVIFAEFVPGGSLAAAIAKRGPIAEDADWVWALGVLFDLAHGLAHAHAAGIVHQDIKPANVLLDGAGAKITDFGIAGVGKARRAASSARAGDGAATIAATTIGLTPLYGSPEQLAVFGYAGAAPKTRGTKRAGKAPLITRATDVWSAGLTLFEMFAGEARWPIGDRDVVLEAARDAPEDVRALLSDMLATDPGARPTALAVAARVADMLGRRGAPRGAPSAADLRADGLNNRAVSALDLDHVVEARALLREALDADPCHAEAVYNAALLDWRSGETTDLGAIDRLKQALSSGATWEGRLLEAWLEIERGDEARALSALDAVADAGAGSPRVTRAVARASRALRDAVREAMAVRAHPGTADCLSLTADGSGAITGGRDGRIGVFDARSGEQRALFRAHEGYVFDAVASARREGVIFSVGWDGNFRAHDSDGLQLFSAAQEGELASIVLSADERRAWSASLRGTLRAWSLDDTQPPVGRDLFVSQTGLSVLDALPTPDGARLHVLHEFEIQIVDASTGDLIQKIDETARCMVHARADNGRWLALTGTNRATIMIRDLETLEVLGELKGLTGDASFITVSVDGRHLVCGSGRGFCLWDLTRRRLVRTFASPALVCGARFLANGDLLSVDWDGYLRRYELRMPESAPFMVAAPRSVRELGAGRARARAAVEAGRRALQEDRIADALEAARSARGTSGFERDADVMALWEEVAKRGRRRRVRAAWPLGKWGPVRASCRLALHVGRGHVASASEGKLTVWALPTGNGQAAPAALHEVPLEGFPTHVAGSPDGRWVGVLAYDSLTLLDTESGVVRTVPTSGGRAVGFGNARVAIAARGGIRVLRLDDLSPVATVSVPETYVNCLAFVDAGMGRRPVEEERLAVGDFRGHLSVFDLSIAAQAEGSPPAELTQAWPDDAFLGDLLAGNARSVGAVRVDDRGVVAAVGGGVVHVARPAAPGVGSVVVDIATDGQPGSIGSVDFIEGDLALVGAGLTLSVVDLSCNRRVAKIEGHTHHIWDARVLDPHHIITASDDGFIRRFYVDWEVD